jgi:hypothetical protein
MPKGYPIKSEPKCRSGGFRSLGKQSIFVDRTVYRRK